MGGGGAARRVAAVAALVVAVAVWAGVASAAVYEVGDKTGWTIMGNPDYRAWANSKTFHPGDIVVFTYNKQFHNVLAVSNADYMNCNATKPTATWSTGNDSVVLNTTGDHYFLCGYPGHCAAGQKVDIPVVSSAAPSSSPTAAPSPTPSGSKPSGGAPAAPSPHPNAAPKALSATSVAAAVAASLLSLAAAVLP